MHIELLKPHTHAGVAYPPRAVIELDADLAQWLIDTGVARTIAAPASVEHNPKPFSRNEEKSK